MLQGLDVGNMLMVKPMDEAVVGTHLAHFNGNMGEFRRDGFQSDIHAPTLIIGTIDDIPAARLD